MVVFTCSYCGEPVKKPAVSKHYDTKCYGRNPNLTCVDCLKDFRGSEYEAHTKCISESERYGAKGSFTGNTINKGEKKQQEWSEHVLKVLESTTLKADERNLLEVISKHENIPRQKKKFENFLNSAYKSLRLSSELINRVWEKIKPAENTASNNSNKNAGGKENNSKPEEKIVGSPESRKRKHDEALSEIAPENPTELPDNSNNQKNKKSKKSKKEKNKKDAKVEITENNSNFCGVESESAKKKSKKSKKNAVEEKVIDSGVDLNGAELDSTKKKDKKKSKKTKKENDVDATQEQIFENSANNINPKLESSKKKDKKKQKNEIAEAVKNVQQELINNEPPKNEGKKGKKKKSVNGAVLKTTQEVINEKKNSDKKPEDSEPKFCWETAILNFLAKKENEEKILLEKMQKKVFKLCTKSTGIEITKKQHRRFSKKLKSLQRDGNITVKDEYVIVHKNENIK